VLAPESDRHVLGDEAFAGGMAEAAGDASSTSPRRCEDGFALHGAYTAAKHGVLVSPGSSPLELATQGVTVNAICRVTSTLR